MKMIMPPPNMQDPNMWKRMSVFQLIYSLAGLILGFVCIIGGIILFLHGVTGSISWITTALGAESKISNAAPGAILFVVGLFIILFTRFGGKSQK